MGGTGKAGRHMRARARLEKLSLIEKKTYNFIKDAGEIQTRNISDKRMIGAVANLKNKELVEIYMSYTSVYKRKKKKFVRIKPS